MKVADITLASNVRKGEVKASPGLIKSIERLGVLQPVGVDVDGELVFGHRRLDAVIQLGKDEIPHVVVDNNGSRIETQVAENQQREGLTQWELSQAAWDLKGEGLKQGEVAEAMLIGVKDISRMQKLAKTISQDTEVDDAILNTLDFDQLELLASDSDEGAEVAISDVLVKYMEQDGSSWSGRSIRNARSDVADEVRSALFLEQIADELNMLNDKGVVILPNNIEKKQTKAGSMVNDPLVARIGKKPKGYQYDGMNFIDIPLDTHVLLECHRAWVDEGSRFGGSSGEIVHLCADVKSHAAKGKSDVKMKGATSDAKKKVEASVERRALKEATELRFRQAGIWVKATRVADVQEMAYELAIATLRGDDYRSFNRMLGTAAERPKGADFGWHKERFEIYMDEHNMVKEEGLAKRQRFIVALLAALPFVEDKWGTQAHADEISAVVVPTDGDE